MSCTIFRRNVAKRQLGSNKPAGKGKTSIRFNSVTGKPLKCYLCEGNHSVYHCTNLTGTTYEQKTEIVKAKRLCFRCPRSGHGVAKCKKPWTCRMCRSDKHHNKVHTLPKEDEVNKQQVMSNAASSSNHDYLRILPVIATAHDSNQVSTFIALLDHPSDASLSSQSFRKNLEHEGKG